MLYDRKDTLAPVLPMQGPGGSAENSHSLAIDRGHGGESQSLQANICPP